jgi:two-component system response regulator MprA
MQAFAPAPVDTPDPLAAAKLLVVEGDERQAATLVAQLVALGYQVSHVADGRTAAAAIAENHFDAVLLDRMLPGMDGIEVLRWMRREGVSTPVILLTALGRLAERIEGLEAGAEDYIVKPYEIGELNARIRVQLRRSATAATEDRSTLSAGDITVSLLSHRAFRGGKAIDLHKTELRLLTELVRGAGRVLSRETLLERVWGHDFVPTTNIVEAYVRRLRMKLAMPGLPDPITTIRGAGYKLND